MYRRKTPVYSGINLAKPIIVKGQNEYHQIEANNICLDLDFYSNFRLFKAKTF